MDKAQLEKTLEKYVPPQTAGLLVAWIVQYKVSVKLTRERKSKLGDYRPPYGRNGHRISINHNLNPYQFLITFVHEIAHLITWEKHQHKVSPHGPEWKEHYTQLMQLFLQKEIFPPEIEKAITLHIQSPAAASCRDEQLYKTLRQFDVKNEDKNKWLYLEDLPHHMLFAMEDDRIFRKGEKLRKYFRCIDMENKRYYRVSGVAMVRPLTAIKD